jgi:hypothetical protein
MAFSITCPSCSAKLKTASALPVGRSVQCPKCKTTFAVSKENMEEVANTKSAMPAATAARAGAKPAAAAKPAPPASAARKTRGDEDDEDAAPRARKRDEDDDEKPRARRRDEEDDETPRARKRGDEDDDRPRARKKARGEDDEDDDRPRRRGRDDEDDDDRPRRGKKGKKKKSGAMLYVMIGVGVLLVGGLIWLLIYMFSGGSYDKEMMAYMPESTAIVGGADVEALMKVDMLKEMLDKGGAGAVPGMPGGGGAQDLTKGLKEAGLSFGDISKVMFGTPDDAKKAEGWVAVARFKKDVDKGKIAGALKATEAKEGGKTYYKGAAGALFFPKDDLLVLAEKEDTLKKLMNKEEGKVVINDTLKELADKVGGGNVWVATSSNPGNAAGLGPIGMMTGGDADVTNALKNAKGGALKVDIDNSRIKAAVYLKCADSGAASKLADSLNKQLKDAKQKMNEMLSKVGGGGGPEVDVMKDAVNSISIDSSGDTFEASGKINYGAIKDKFKGGGGMPFGGL